MLRLRRVKGKLSHYETLDGKYEILKDPQSGNEPDGWGVRIVVDIRERR